MIIIMLIEFPFFANVFGAFLLKNVRAMGNDISHIP